MGNKNKIVQDYLVKRERRSLKRIELGSNLNHKVFVLTIALIGVLPLIPEANKNSFEIITSIGFSFDYKFLVSIYFGILIGLLIFNIVIGLINIKRKVEYRIIVKEIQKLKSSKI